MCCVACTIIHITLHASFFLPSSSLMYIHTQDLTGFMNPFHNMAKYRELQRATQPPFIPLFPIIKKDLTFLFDGNESRVEGLVNFEKLRNLSQQIRNVCKFCEMPMMVSVGVEVSVSVWGWKCECGVGWGGVGWR